MGLNILFFYHAYLIYLLSFFIYYLALFRKRINLLDWGYGLLILAFLIHSFSFILRTSEAGYLPTTNLFESVSFFVWAIVLVWIILNLRYQTIVLGIFILPVIILLLSPSFFAEKNIQPLNPLLRQNYLFGLHTTLVFLGYAGFTLSFIGGLAYLILEKEIKSKAMTTPEGYNIFHSLPSLEVLDLVNYRAIIFGTILLVGGIFTGSLGLRITHGVYWIWTEPKLIWSLFNLFIYLLLLFLRSFYVYPGKKVALFSIFCFLILIFSFFGINYIFSGFHRFL